ncbi:hypothetical protein EDC18_101138 [Natranaerovirga pectinivora]|uniref:Uncharacterized protein n=1 Tax=Natranaerovirga pectinivora TaxID=682400 RepID=A0A4R3MPS0_9FIRM|nr:hypothetical protein [Natranaerovirga pectinivora]TCT16842.1 hypothetical protein EDC18_101138 [Natranaerovirga pectinivora]
MLNSIYEERQRQDDKYHISLSLSREEYSAIYGQDISKSKAQEIVEEYLQWKEDDGRPDNITIFDYPESDIINIELDLHYLGNDHTGYENGTK